MYFSSYKGLIVHLSMHQRIVMSVASRGRLWFDEEYSRRVDKQATWFLLLVALLIRPSILRLSPVRAVPLCIQDAV